MADDIREIKEGINYQGSNESISYTLTIPTTWGTAPTSPVANIYTDNRDGTYADVTSTNMSGTATVSGQVITLPLIQALTIDQMYRVDVKWQESGGTLSAYAFIMGER